jgi:hypothetical protein
MSSIDQDKQKEIFTYFITNYIIEQYYVNCLKNINKHFNFIYANVFNDLLRNLTMIVYGNVGGATRNAGEYQRNKFNTILEKQNEQFFLKLFLI